MEDINPIELTLKAQAWTIMEKGIKDPKMPEAARALRHCMKSSMQVARKIMEGALKEAAVDFEHANIEDAVKFARQAGLKLEL